MELLVVKHAGPTRDFVLLPRRWVVGRVFTWIAALPPHQPRYERLAQALRALDVSAHALTLLARGMRDFGRPNLRFRCAVPVKQTAEFRSV